MTKFIITALLALSSSFANAGIYNCDSETNKVAITHGLNKMLQKMKSEGHDVDDALVRQNYAIVQALEQLEQCVIKFWKEHR